MGSVFFAVLLVFLLVEEEIFFRRVVGPNFLYAFVYVAVIFYLLQIFEYFKRCAGTYSIVNQLFFRGRPWCIFEFGCEFECPIHKCKF